MYETLLYDTDGPVAVITLNRPEQLNTIVPPMTDELEAAVNQAVRDSAVKVVVLQGAGRSFCAGFNFSGGFHQWDDRLTTDGRWDPGKEFIATTSPTLGWVPKFMALWRSPKPVITQVHGWCVGGGSEMALCSDIVVASDDARFGTPYSRMWGCHHAGMWVYRLGLARAKELALTGRWLSGREAAEIGLINQAVPFAELQDTVWDLVEQLVSIPLSQLTAMKLIVNQAYENMGLASTQMVGSLLDGMLRNTPEALAWVDQAESEGVGAAVATRDGPFGDYSQAPKEERPDPANVIVPGRRPRRFAADEERA
jgi:enoyl-CoA hydratase